MIYVTEHSVPRIPQLGGGIWMLRNLTDVTVLLGKNGSGKSALLRSWRDQQHEHVHYIAPERTGEMDFQPQLLPEEMDSAPRRSASMRNFVTDYRRRIIGRIQAYFMMRGAVRGGRPAPSPPEELETLLATLTPDFELIFEPRGIPYRLTRVATQEVITHVDYLSSGEAQLLTIGLDILTIAAMWEIESRGERVILIDEPDAHIHPDLQSRFAEFVLRIAGKFAIQFVIATHSTSLLSALGQFGGAATSVIYLDRIKTEYVAKTFDDASRELASILGGHVLMGTLFGAPLLLVEGDDDFRIWSQVPRHHVLDLAVIPTNGDEIRRYQLTLERILRSLSDPQEKPVGYALLDGDKAIPQPNPDNPQQFIRYLRLACHEAENLYLSDEVLASFGTTWHDAALKIEIESPSFGGNAPLLATATAWDRRNHELKRVIENISRIIDPKAVPWTLRVGATIGRARPIGQLADFLGPQLIAALWGPESPGGLTALTS